MASEVRYGAPNMAVTSRNFQRATFHVQQKISCTIITNNLLSNIQKKRDFPHKKSFGKTKEQVSRSRRAQPIKRRFDRLQGNPRFVFTQQTARGLELKKGEKVKIGRKFILNSNFCFKAFKIPQI